MQGSRREQARKSLPAERAISEITMAFSIELTFISHRVSVNADSE